MPLAAHGASQAKPVAKTGIATRAYGGVNAGFTGFTIDELGGAGAMS